jgi:nucleotide-binding universal stress UspA family protein
MCIKRSGQRTWHRFFASSAFIPVEQFMIKDIILNLERDKSGDGARDYAISIAEMFEAHLAGVAFADGAGIPPYMMPDFPSDMLTSMVAESEAAMRASVERFEAAAKRSALSIEHRFVTQSDLGPPDAFSMMARRFDLSVVMQSDDDKSVNNDVMIEAALFNSGRPVIIVPYIQKSGLKLDRIVCCWDGSRAAARAVNDALPFLKRARVVELFIVANEKTRDKREILGVEIGGHLARHGIKVEVESVPASDIDVADAILSHVSDCSANMIVMGGYGHSRLREFVLGGVTRGILATMTVPVFMSH